MAAKKGGRKKSGRKYGKAAGKRVASAMRRKKKGTLKSGRGGKGGKVTGSSLESSNTDIADEFTKLIVTQQAYSANTKVITTANTMVQDLLNVIR